MRRLISGVFILAFICAITAYAWKHAECTRSIDNVDGTLVATNFAGANGSNNGLMNGVASAHADVSGNSYVGHDTQHFISYIHVWAADTGPFSGSGLAYFAASGYDSSGNFQYISAQDSN